MSNALIIIDVQNDYFDGGIYPQFEADKILLATKQAIEKATANDWLIIFIKHESEQGFLVKATSGADIHPELTPYLDKAVTVIKTHADSFLNTKLDSILQEHHISELTLTGVMTQNCVTHTAISKQAEKYTVNVIADACTAPTQMIHQIALQALADRVNVI